MSCEDYHTHACIPYANMQTLVNIMSAFYREFFTRSEIKYMCMTLYLHVQILK